MSQRPFRVLLTTGPSIINSRHVNSPTNRISCWRRLLWRQPTSPPSLPSPTFPRKFADVDWGSRKIIPNKICAECWTGAAFGPYWLLTERLRYETTPLLPALRDRVHVYGQLDDARGSHRGGDAASGIRWAAGASRRHGQRHGQGRGRRQHKYARSKQRDKQRHRHPRKHHPTRPRWQQHPRRHRHTQQHHCNRHGIQHRGRRRHRHPRHGRNRNPHPPPSARKPPPPPRPSQPPQQTPPTPTPPPRPKTASPSPSRGTTPPRAPRRLST